MEPEAGVDAGALAAPVAAKATPLVASCSLCGASARRPLQGNLKFLCFQTWLMMMMMMMMMIMMTMMMMIMIMMIRLLWMMLVRISDCEIVVVLDAPTWFLTSNCPHFHTHDSLHSICKSLEHDYRQQCQQPDYILYITVSGWPSLGKLCHLK